MLRKYTKETITELKTLRTSGVSIDELVVKFNIPKSTVWHHVGRIKISSDKRKILRSRQGGSSKIKELNIQKAKSKANEILSSSDKKRELAIIISMLYWAEGSKKSCEFINSDGRMIALYLYIIRNLFGIGEDFIKPTMRVFTGMDRKMCLEYWSKVTNIPKRNFVVRLNDGGTNCRTKYGMCRITIKKGHNTLKLLLSLIDSVLSEIKA